MNATYSDPTVTWSSALGFTYDGAGGQQPPTGTGTYSGPTLKRVPDLRPATLFADMLTVFKQHARIPFDFDDALCSLYLRSAASRWEQITQVPVAPASYDWYLPEHMRHPSSRHRLPIQNCSLAAEPYGFEPLATWHYATITTWPVRLECGFTKLDDVPADIALGIYEIALFLYEQRSTPEMVNGLLDMVAYGITQRYWTPRC